MQKLEQPPPDPYDDEEEDDKNNPDLRGVHVDGFPLPKIPIILVPNQSAKKRSINNTSFLPPLFVDSNHLQGNDESNAPLLPPSNPFHSRSLLTSGENNDDAVATATITIMPPPIRVIIAGGGLGGLALASALYHLHDDDDHDHHDTIPRIDVHVMEKTNAYRPFGGPIQIQSNALWALGKIHPPILQCIQQCGVQTGDRLSGIQDGKTRKRRQRRYSNTNNHHDKGEKEQQEQEWLVRFDAATPARNKGLPLTLAINRVTLQDIFLKYGIPSERVHAGCPVVSYQNIDGGVLVQLADGRTVHGDILIGADGIWSRVRHQMFHLPADEIGPKFAHKHARYSGYTCYTGTCRYTPLDIDEVAYKVFLGQQQYLGCTDAGAGFQHWWAFLSEPPGGVDTTEPALDKLKRKFQDWNPEIHHLLDATDPTVVQRRDLYDRLPLSYWTDGNVALLGDAAHPTMPNLGQGGAMAIEDAYVLAQELKSIRHTNEIPRRLQAYERRRYVRASIAQFLSRNGSDLLVDWDKLRNTPIVGPIALQCINWAQPLSMNYLYSADI
jgi:zeaxanthin epoxidase